MRHAGEDDNKLDEFMRNGLMQRHSRKTSTFVAIHEPFKNQHWIESVHTNGRVVIVRYTLNGAEVEDRVVLNDKEIIASSSAGWKYSSGAEHSGLVEALESDDGKWRLKLDYDAPMVNYIRLDLSDGGTLYYPVVAVQGRWLELADDPGFTIEPDSGKVLFRTFPNDQYAGPLRYTLFGPVKTQ